MMALIVLTGDDVLEAYELRLLDIMELFDGEELRRSDVRMVEKDNDWKREVRMAADRSSIRKTPTYGKIYSYNLGGFRAVQGVSDV